MDTLERDLHDHLQNIQVCQYDIREVERYVARTVSKDPDRTVGRDKGTLQEYEEAIVSLRVDLEYFKSEVLLLRRRAKEREYERAVSAGPWC